MQSIRLVIFFLEDRSICIRVIRRLHEIVRHAPVDAYRIQIPSLITIASPPQRSSAMKITAGNLLLVAGLGLLVYTGYQAMTCTCCADQFPTSLSLLSLFTPSSPPPHHSMSTDRETLRLAQQEFDGLPPQLLWLLVASVATSLIGGLQTSGSLKLISLADAPQYVQSPYTAFLLAHLLTHLLTHLLACTFVI